MGKNAVAHSIGGVNLIDPPHNEMSKHVSRMTDGTEMRTVVVWKKALTQAPIPVIYMW
jgi:hypothetical protein